MALILKSIGGLIILGLVGLVGNYYYLSSYVPNAEFDYSNATYEERAEYLKSFGELMVFAGSGNDDEKLEVSFGGVNIDQRKVYIDYQFKTLDVTNSPYAKNIFETLLRKDLATAACKMKSQNEGFDINQVILSLNFHDKNSTRFGQLELSRDNCQQLS